MPSPKAAMALVDRACSMIGTPAPLEVLAAGVEVPLDGVDHDADLGVEVGDAADVEVFARVGVGLGEHRLDLFVGEAVHRLDVDVGLGAGVSARGV